MTRINCVPVESLCDQHLLAEYRELPRVFGLVTAAVKRGERPDDPRNPKTYTLGSGHVRFFYPRLFWLNVRQDQIVTEMFWRGFKPQFTDSLWSQFNEAIPFKTGWWGVWVPSEADIALNQARINERLPAKARWSYPAGRKQECSATTQ